MSGMLYDSPAKVVAKLLVDLGQATPPASNAAWPVSAGGEPSSPDNCITVRNTLGRADGRSQPDGEQQFHHGLQVRVRSTDEPTGYLKGQQIATALSGVLRASVTVPPDVGTGPSSTYCVQSISMGEVLSIGKEPVTKRSLFTINAVVAMRQDS